MDDSNQFRRIEQRNDIRKLGKQGEEEAGSVLEEAVSGERSQRS